MKSSHRVVTLRLWVAGAIIVILAGGIAYGTYRFVILSHQNRDLGATVETLRASVQSLQGNLSLTAYERDQITEVLDNTQTQAADLQGQVSDFQKLNSLDPELLKKYSKVYFLNEQYVPSSLVNIDTQYISGAGRTLQFHADAYPFLKQMLDDSALDGVHLRVASAYRSFGTQAALKSEYKVIYGAGTANQFSADQGYSEHQLGTTVDLTTVKTGTLTSSFDTTAESAWMLANAYKYGFILSYPKNNKYYEYEPWHWRFVGIALATYLHDNNKHLYDMDQRDIDPYLLHIFDEGIVNTQ